MKKISILAAMLLFSQLLCGAVWYKENLAYGLRDSIFLFLSFSDSDPNTMYLSTTDGFLFSSHNGGVAWNEARIIVKFQPFFGKVRGVPTVDGVPISVNDVMGGINMTGLGGYSLQRSLALDFGPTEDSIEFLEQDALAERSEMGSVNVPGVSVPGGFKVKDSSCGIVKGDASKLGVALKTGAPRLKGMLRGYHMPSVGMNLQQLLVEMGVEPTWINHIGVHPSDPNVALAATSMGTYKTTDGGIGWIPVFGGTNRWERDGQHVRFDPVQHDRVYLGTQNGLFISSSGGDRWERVSGTQLEGACVRWIEPLVTADGEVWIYAGTTIGGFLSKDSGDTWRWIYFETLPQTNHVTSVAVDKDDPEHVLFSTFDGVFVTFNGGEKWERTGGLLFTNTFVPRIVIDPTNGSHAIAATERNVWETYDDGKTWQVLYIDNGDWRIRSIALDPHEEGTIWIVTSGELLRLRQYARATSKNERVALFRELFSAEPTEMQLLDAIYRNLHVHPGQHTKYREKAKLSFFVPQVRAVGGYMRVKPWMTTFVYPWKELYDEPSLDRGYVYGNWYFGLTAWWDFGGTVFDFDEINYGRIFGEMNRSMLNSKFEMARYYNERIRLMYKLIVEPPEDLQTYLDAALRYRELTEHLDALADGIYSEHLEAIRQGGIEWLQGLDY